MNTKESKSEYLFSESDIDWQELADIGILRDEIELNGQMDKLLRGEKTDVISVRLMLIGADVEMDATLQFISKDESPLLEIIGIKPVG